MVSDNSLFPSYGHEILVPTGTKALLVLSKGDIAVYLHERLHPDSLIPSEWLFLANNRGAARPTSLISFINIL